MRAAPLAMLALLLLAAPAAATLEYGFAAPVRVTLLPQLGCEIAFDEGGAGMCDVYGVLSQANELRIRAAGATRVVALADDEATGRGLAVADCPSLCVKGFAPTTTGAGALHVRAWGQPGAVVTVSVGNGFGTVLA